MKKYLVVIMLLILSSLSFATGQIKANSMRFNRIPAQMVIDLSGTTKPVYTENYDEENRLIFLELQNTEATAEFVSKQLNGKYVKRVDVVKYPNSMGLFVHLQKNIDYKLSYRGNPTRLIIEFSKKGNKKEYTVIIDSGHGGKDAGAVGFKKYKEKDVVFEVAKYLKDKLKDDFNIVMTRSTDEFISLNERARIGNRVKGDLFISIHANASTVEAANGFEVFYYSKKSSPYAAKVAAFENSFGNKYGEDVGSIAKVKGETEYNNNKVKSAKMAEDLSKSYSKKLGMRDRGTHGANFAVLRGFSGSGILVELGFITNTKDLQKLKQKKYQKIMAEEIEKSVRHHFY